MQDAEKADLVSKYTERLVQDMGHSELVDMVQYLIFHEKMELDEGELVGEIMEYYPDLLPEGE